ncbi:MAG: hypothetical protein HXM17_10475, partial [Fusobacterium periodonticum]|nr:hypothetical protein [Fusobacterium periodonticum]
KNSGKDVSSSQHKPQVEGSEINNKNTNKNSGKDVSSSQHKPQVEGNAPNHQKFEKKDKKMVIKTIVEYAKIFYEYSSNAQDTEEREKNKSTNAQDTEEREKNKSTK